MTTLNSNQVDGAFVHSTIHTYILSWLESMTYVVILSPFTAAQEHDVRIFPLHAVVDLRLFYLEMGNSECSLWNFKIRITDLQLH